MTDRFGREFTVGVRVVYGVRDGNTGALRDGVIEKIIPTTRIVWNYKTRQREDHEWCTLYIRGYSESLGGDVKRTLRIVHEVDRVVVVP